jgi:hypothetical protein
MNTNTTTNQLLAEVLRPTPAATLRHVKPAVFKPNTPEAGFIEKAAARVRDVYLAGARAAAAQFGRFDPDACFDTWMTVAELDQAIADEKTAAIAKAVFQRAGFDDRLQPTTLRAQVEMQLIAVETAQHARQLFGQQLNLAMA